MTTTPTPHEEWKAFIKEKYAEHWPPEDHPYHGLSQFVSVGPGWRHIVEELLDLASSKCKRFDEVGDIKRRVEEQHRNDEDHKCHFSVCPTHGDERWRDDSGRCDDGCCSPNGHYPLWVDRYYERVPERPRMWVHQIKEKFGTLRWYHEAHHMPGFYDAVRLAESLSYRICEDCGALGYQRDGSWIRTLCDDCHGRAEGERLKRMDKYGLLDEDDLQVKAEATAQEYVDEEKEE